MKIQLVNEPPTYACNEDKGLHNGGAGECVTKGTCSGGFKDDGTGTCIAQGAACSSGYHDGGSGACVAAGTCSGGFKDDGTGTCIAQGAACSSGYHDGGSGACVAAGTCSGGFKDDGTGTCIAQGTPCASGYRDGGDGLCVPVGTCSVGHLGSNCEVAAAVVDVPGGTSSGVQWDYYNPSGAQDAGTSVTVSGFKLDKTEVTVDQYSACVTAGACTFPIEGGCSGNWLVGGRGQHPMNCVNWYQATAFCSWAGKRLPTEIEWQWAASNGGTTTYPWGNAAPDDSRAQYISPGTPVWQGTAAVGTHPAGNTALGVQDMSGNVIEWTASALGNQRGVRGGCHMSPDVGLAAALRDSETPDSYSACSGFRCAQ